MSAVIEVSVTTFFFPNIVRDFRKVLETNTYVEDVIRLCAEEFNVNAHSFPFFGLRLELNDGDKYWLAPNRTLESEKAALTKGKLYFRFRFKPARSLSRTGLGRLETRGEHFGFRALLQQSLAIKDDLWFLLLGQCEKDLEKETLELLHTKKEARVDFWSLLLMGRSETTLQKLRWKSSEIEAALPLSLRKQKQFLKDVKSCIPDATRKFNGKGLHDGVWITFLEEYVYENMDRFIDKYPVMYEGSQRNSTGVVFIDTQECTCYPLIKVFASDLVQDICSLKDIDSFSISNVSLKLLLRRQGQVCTFHFAAQKDVLSFAAELDAQFRTSIDWYANLCSDEPKSVYSPRVEMLKRNFVLPPAGHSISLRGVKLTDDIPASMLNFRPFVLQQSSQKVSCLKATFASHVPDVAEMNWQIRFTATENFWTIQDFSGYGDFEEDTNLHKHQFDSLDVACRALLGELLNRGVTFTEDQRQTDAIVVRLAHIGRSPRIHFIDPELVEDMSSHGSFQGLPVLAMSSSNCHHRVIKLVNIADGDCSRFSFAAWNGMQYLLREYSGQRNHILSRFWLAAELSSLWSHYGLAPVVAFSPASAFYLLEFASNGPVDIYLTQGGCNSAVYLTHLLLAIKTLLEAVAYLSSRNFVHGDIRLANVILLSHTVEPPVSFIVKLIPPELSFSNSGFDENLPSHRIVFVPQNDSSPRSDVYSLGVTMIQLLRLGHIPTMEDVDSIRSEEDPNLVNFLEDILYFRDEFAGPVKCLFSVIRNCLVFNNEIQAASFLTRCAVEIDRILAVVRNLPLVTLNAATDKFSLSIESGMRQWFHIPFLEIFPSEDCLIGGVGNNGQIDASRTFTRLSSGHFGEVLLGFWKKRQSNQVTKVALKRLLNNRPDDSQMTIDRLRQEFHIWSNLRHPNIVQVFGLTWINERPVIVMEYIKDGLTLESFIKGKARDVSFFKEMTSLLIQVTSGMRFLSERNCPIVHCDLAARNVLVSIENSLTLTAKIADFGLACLVEPQTYYHRLPSSQQLPVAWCAPEIFDCRATPQSDVYSFGVLSWEVLCQKNPKQDERNRRRRQDDRNNSNNLYVFLPDVPDRLAEVLIKCQKQNPHERPTFEMLETLLKEILENDFH